ncbi:MAG TPA: type II secretion system protein GspK [Xanthobacteraceae bacterium]|nr:type II secretion system protein GspK [Xanthobacteraceae bacterium]
MVAVLWMLGALATLAAIYAVYVINAATGLSVNDDRLKAEALTRAALELTAYRVTSADAETRPSRGDFLFRLGRATVAVEFRSEAARIDLNMASRELLAGLLAGLGAPYANAAYYADRIVGWRTTRDADAPDVEGPAYRTAGLSYRPRQAPFAHVGELSLVLGLPPALVERALPFVTVFSGRPEVNIMDAAPEVLAALPGMTPDRLYAVLSQRGTGPQAAQFLLRLVGTEQSSATSEASKAMRVGVRMDLENGRRVRAEAVILLLEDGPEPFRVLSWRDDFDGPS